MKRLPQTQTEWEIEMAGKVLTFTKDEIYMELRYMEYALSGLTFKASEDIKNFATDGIYMYYSPEQVIRLFKNNQKYLDRLYLHIVLHCIFSHLWIGGKREEQLWDLACDISVEYTIDHLDKNCTRRALTFLRQDMYEKLRKNGKGMSAAVVYELIYDFDAEQKNSLWMEFHTDDHQLWHKKQDSQASQSLANDWQKRARQVSLEQKRKGQEPKEKEQLLQQQLKVEKSRRSYRDFLRKFAVLREEMSCDPDEFDLNYYMYGLNLYGNMPLIEPLETREIKKVQEFVIVIDTSYSTSGELVKNFLKETCKILSEQNSYFRESHIRILQCDDSVHYDRKIKNMDEIDELAENFTLIGGGNTDFRPAFEYVEALRESGELKDLRGLIYFTDGKGIYPSKRPDYDTAFLFMADHDAEAVPAWAIRMRLDKEELEKI